LSISPQKAIEDNESLKQHHFNTATSTSTTTAATTNRHQTENVSLHVVCVDALALRCSQ